MPKKLTHTEVIERFTKKHGDRYDYSNVSYINSVSPVIIICKKHGEFSQKPSHHMGGSDCPKCANENRNTPKSNEKFIADSKLINGDSIDYSKVDYINNKTKVELICKNDPSHGSFFQRPDIHLSQKQGCPKCAGNLPLNTEIFIQRATEIHGEKYDYSQVNYVSFHTPVKIFCNSHQDFFEQTPGNHISNEYGCYECAKKRVGFEKRKDLDQFIKECKEIHNDKYDYSLIHETYEHSKSLIQIICPEHGIFEQGASEHNMGQGCIKCAGKYQPTTEEFIKECKVVHGEKYDYSLTEYTKAHDHIKIICPEHGVFEQYAYQHKNGGCGCPNCFSSKGEDKIFKFLEENSIPFTPQKCFNDLFTINPSGKNGYPRFDFFVNNNICIEFDGEQHNRPVDYFGGVESFNKLQERDLLKKEYCDNNNYKLVRIPYSEMDNIEHILTELLIK